MFADQTTQFFGDPRRNPATTIADTLHWQRRRVVAWLGIYAIAAGGMVAVCAAITLVWFSQWLKTLPVGVEPTLARLIADRPGVLAMSCLGGAVGVLLAVGGMLGWRHLLGRENAPPKKVVFLLGGMPILVGCVAALLAVAKIGFVAVVALPLMLGGTVAIVPIVIGVMGFRLLQIALSLLGQAPVACSDDELPHNVAEYFDQFNAAAQRAGLDFAGNFYFVPKRTKFRRVWIAPNGAYFVDATNLYVGNTPICALSVTSATEDGHYFSTTDLGSTAPASPGLGHCMRLPGAPLAELIERHIEAIANWTENNGSCPLVFDADDQHELFEYGLAAHLQHEPNSLFWLGNPYKNQPLPPLPGRSWPEDAGVADRLSAGRL